MDVIATDHAPHTLEEKGVLLFSPFPLERARMRSYESAHSGLPLIQHSLLLMLHYYKQGKISLEKIAEKMSHAVADCFRIADRGYIREGYFADLIVIDLNEQTSVSKENILYKCGWSPLEGETFPAAVSYTFVNGNCVFENGTFNESTKGSRLSFKV